MTPAIVPFRKKTLFYIIMFLLPVSVGWISFAIYKGVTQESQTRRFELYAPMFQKRESPLNYTLITGWEGEDHSVFIHANSVGVRDREWPENPPEGLRILALGDSQTFGVALDFERVYTQVLEESFRSSGIQARVYNAGIPGWNFSDQLAFLQHHWSRLQPHIVTVMFIENDLDNSITAGASHQLAAPKIPLTPFIRNADPWIMEAFATAYRKDPDLRLTIGNAYKEAWRVEYFPNLFTHDTFTSGKQRYRQYRQEMKTLVKFVRKNNSELFVLVFGRFPGASMERKLVEIFDDLTIPYCLLNQWTGNKLTYERDWSLLPENGHGNSHFHGLVAALIQNFLSNTKVGEVFGVSATKLPNPLPNNENEAMKESVLIQEKRRLENIGNRVSLLEPESQRQVLTMGGQYSQWRAIFKPIETSSVLEIVPAKSANFPTTGTPAVWLQIMDFSGFVPAGWQSSKIWARLPEPLPGGKLVEIGIVAGINSNGTFIEYYPLESITLGSHPPKDLEWSGDHSLLLGDNIQGIYEDGWMGERIKIVLARNTLGERWFQKKLRVTLNGRIPNALYPIRLSAKKEDGTVVSKIVVKSPEDYLWEIGLDHFANAPGNGIVELVCDKTFIPAEYNADSPDRRKLSVRINNLRVKSENPK